jgi:hypothetical protein
MAWTKASVDSGQHTYSEALTLMQAAGFTKQELDTFLAYNPGDLYRVPEAFDLSTGGVDPLSAGQQPRDPITPSSPSYSNPQAIPPVNTSATSGGTSSLFLTLSGSTPAPSSAYPAREAAGLGGGGGDPSAFATAGEGATAALGRIPWVLLIVAAAGVWYLSKGGRG